MIVANLVDLDNLDDAAIERIKQAVRRKKLADAADARRASLVRARAVYAEQRRIAAEAGTPLRKKSPKMTKGELQQRARKAADTTAQRYPREPLPPCEICGGESAAKALCPKHWKAWRRSGVEREQFPGWYAADDKATSTPDRSSP